MAINTPNYSLQKPAVGADDDVWGGMWNSNADIIDTEMQANADAAAANATALEGVVPIGSIMVWYDTIASIPTGWVICDGATHTRSDAAGNITTLDLRQKVVVGAVADTGGGQFETFAITDERGSISINDIDYIALAWIMKI